MKNYRILTNDNKSLWSEYFSKLPIEMQDIYFTPEYYDLYEKNGDGKAFCFVLEEENNLALYPFLLNRINGFDYNFEVSYFDIQGAYGYNGVVYSSEDSEFKKSFYYEFSKFCKENNIIAEFTRFHPLLENYKFSIDYLDVIFNRRTVYIDLTQTYDQLFNRFTSQVKKNILKSEKHNLKCKIYKNDFPFKKDFIEMYNETMDKVQSDRYLYFNDVYFDNLFNNLNLIQFVVFINELPIASALFFYHKFYLHYHLGASKKEYLSYRPNNILFNEVIKFGIEQGFNKLHLGGGASHSEDDSLLRFKKGFSNISSEFFIGEKIYNQKIYNEVCEQWSDKFPELIAKHGSKFLKYRYSI